MPLLDVQARHLSIMGFGIRYSVILLVSAPKMVRIYLVTSSLVRCRRIEARTSLRLQELRCFYKSHAGVSQIVYSLCKHC